MKSNYQIIIEYDGTNYNGWQFQKNGSSIQNEIEKALKEIAKKEKYELLAQEEPTLVSTQFVNQQIFFVTK